jgi:hypothetical protein
MNYLNTIPQTKKAIGDNRGTKKFFQPRLTINTPGDSYEQEADTMAEKVMRIPINDRSFFPAKPVTATGLWRKCADCEEEDKKLQRKQSSNEEAEASNELENYISNLDQCGRPLSQEVRNFYEPRFGYDFSNVKVHTNSNDAKSAQSVNALAYTSGNNIVFNDGQYNPGTDSGKKLLAHELTHVVQQQSNQVSKKIQRTRLHFYDFNDNFMRRGGYAAEYCEDFSYITGQCSVDIPGNKHAAIDNITQAPGWVSLFKSRGHTINEVIFHTHGAPGYVHLPNGGLTVANVSSIASMGSDLPSNALIDFKGCNVAEGPDGEAFLLAVANGVLSANGGRAKGTDSVTFSVPGIGQRRPIWSSRPTACITAGGAAHMC